MSEFNSMQISFVLSDAVMYPEQRKPTQSYVQKAQNATQKITSQYSSWNWWKTFLFTQLETGSLVWYTGNIIKGL